MEVNKWKRETDSRINEKLKATGPDNVEVRKVILGWTLFEDPRMNSCLSLWLDGNTNHQDREYKRAVEWLFQKQRCVLTKSLKGWVLVLYNAAINWTISPQNSYVKAVNFNVIVFGHRAFRTYLRLNEVIKKWSSSNRINGLIREGRAIIYPFLSLSFHMQVPKKSHVRTQWEGDYPQAGKKPNPARPWC